MITISKELIPKLNQFQDDYPEIVLPFFLKKIKLAIKEKKSRVALYQVKNTDFIGMLEIKDISKVLDVLMSGFIDLEMFEEANECKQIKMQIEIDKLISETQRIKL